jgi:hypothetical protein
MGKLVNVLFVVFIVSTVLTGFLWIVGMDTTQWECSTRCVRLHTDCGLSNECPLVKECCVDQFGECIAPDTTCERPVIPRVQRVVSVLRIIVTASGLALMMTLSWSK